MRPGIAADYGTEIIGCEIIDESRCRFSRDIVTALATKGFNRCGDSAHIGCSAEDFFLANGGLNQLERFPRSVARPNLYRFPTALLLFEPKSRIDARFDNGLSAHPFIDAADVNVFGIIEMKSFGYSQPRISRSEFVSVSRDPENKQPRSERNQSASGFH
jgi:hypothetical protein